MEGGEDVLGGQVMHGAPSRRDVFEDSVRQKEEETARRLREENEARIKAQIAAESGAEGGAGGGLASRFHEVVPESNPVDLKALKAKRAAEQVVAAEKAALAKAARERAEAEAAAAAAERALEASDEPAVEYSADGVHSADAFEAADLRRSRDDVVASKDPSPIKVAESHGGGGGSEHAAVQASVPHSAPPNKASVAKKPSVDVVDGRTGTVEAPRNMERGILLQRGEFKTAYDTITIPAAQPRNKRLALSSAGLRAFAMKTAVLVSTKGFDGKLRSLLITNPAGVGVRDLTWAPASESDMFALLFAILDNGSVVMHVVFVERTFEGATGLSLLKTETLTSPGPVRWSKCRAIGSNLKGKVLLVPESGSKAQLVGYMCTPKPSSTPDNRSPYASEAMAQIAAPDDTYEGGNRSMSDISNVSDRGAEPADYDETTELPPVAAADEPGEGVGDEYVEAVPAHEAESRDAVDHKLAGADNTGAIGQDTAEEYIEADVVRMDPDAPAVTDDMMLPADTSSAYAAVEEYDAGEDVGAPQQGMASLDEGNYGDAEDEGANPAVASESIAVDDNVTQPQAMSV